MKYSILGFSQEKIIELGLDLSDALLLRYFVDFKDTGKMLKEEMDGRSYYWVKYEHIKEYLPVLQVSSDRIYRKLKNLAKIGVLEHKTVRNHGTYSYYALGKRYLELIDSEIYSKGSKEEKTTIYSVKIPEQKIYLLNISLLKIINL